MIIDELKIEDVKIACDLLKHAFINQQAQEFQDARVNLHTKTTLLIQSLYKPEVDQWIHSNLTNITTTQPS